MLKKTYLLILMISLALFSISCSDNENNTTKTCSPVCESWEECSDDAVCVLLDNKCNSDADCKTAEKTKCNLDTHECIAENIEECTNDATKCSLNTLLVCENNVWVSTDCTLNDEICKTNEKNSSCEAKEVEQTEFTIPEIKALTVEKTVITEGVITYINIFDNKVAGFYMQESMDVNGAIYVFIKDGVASNLKLGDTVKVTGKAWNRFGVNRIGDNDNTPSFEIIDSTSTIPTPKEMNSVDLSIGEVDMLINISNVPFTVTAIGEAPLYHTILQDSNGNELVIDSKLYRFNENGLTVGSIVSNIKGIQGSYQNDDLTFIFLVLPRDANDITFTNDGTEGHTCLTTEPKCLEGLKCNENNVCEIKLPCDDACTETQYCNTETDVCIDLVVEPISSVRALTEDKLVLVEGVVTQYKRHNQTTANYYIQDDSTPYSAIQIYFKNASPPALSIGDKIRVIGLANSYQGFVEIGTADLQPTITILENNINTLPKSITTTEINEENLYLLVELANPPFTVTEVEFAHPKYVTFTDNLGNSFILNNDWINDWEYFFVGDVLTSLKGLVSYRYENGITFTFNPRTEDDFEFMIE